MSYTGRPCMGKQFYNILRLCVFPTTASLTARMSSRVKPQLHIRLQNGRYKMKQYTEGCDQLCICTIADPPSEQEAKNYGGCGIALYSRV